MNRHQDLGVLLLRCADAHGSGSSWWARPSKATAWLRPIQISYLHVAALRDDALDLINRLFVCLHNFPQKGLLALPKDVNRTLYNDE